MAAPVWRPIDLPNLSIRDLALAGNQISSSFDRLGQVLLNREAQLRQQATDAAAAEAFMAGTPEEIAALRARGLGGMDRRVDRLAFAKSLGEAENQILGRQATRNQLSEHDAKVWAGQFAPGLLDAAGDLSREGMDRVRELASADANYDRFAYALAPYLQDAEGIYGQADTRRETGRHNQATEAGQAADRALRQREFNLRMQQQQELDQGYLLGQRFADKYRLHDTASAAALLADDPEFRQLSPRAQQGALQSFTPTHQSLTARTDVADAAFTGTDAELARRALAREAEGSRAENQAKDPSLTALRRAGTYGDSVTMDSLAADLAERGGWTVTKAQARTAIQQIQAANPKASLADIKAAIDVNGFDPGLARYIPGLPSQLANLFENRALSQRVRMMTDQRAQGYTENEPVDIATARAPLEAEAAQLEKLREQANRYYRAEGRVPDHITDQIMRILEQAEERNQGK